MLINLWSFWFLRQSKSSLHIFNKLIKFGNIIRIRYFISFFFYLVNQIIYIFRFPIHKVSIYIYYWVIPWGIDSFTYLFHWLSLLWIFRRIFFYSLRDLSLLLLEGFFEFLVGFYHDCFSVFFHCLLSWHFKCMLFDIDLSVKYFELF